MWKARGQRMHCAIGEASAKTPHAALQTQQSTERGLFTAKE